MPSHSLCINYVIYFRITDNGSCAELLLDTLGDELVNIVDKKQRLVTGQESCRVLILSYTGKTRSVVLCGNGMDVCRFCVFRPNACDLYGRLTVRF